MSNQFHTLRVLAVENPIKDATTITFDIPADLTDTFNYHPGQYLTIKFFVNGEEARRSYSLNSCPLKEEALQVTVKRVKGGLVSNYVGDYLKAGDELEVMAPQGLFYADVQKDDYKTYFLFAAGSGITPVISILKSVLIGSPNSSVKLFYGNSNQDSIIFKEELDELQQLYPERLQVVHTLSRTKVWTTWKRWKGRKGRIDSPAVEWFIENHPPMAQNTEYYICGPGQMNNNVQNSLINLGIPKDFIHIEQFGGNSEELDKDVIGIDNAQLSASLDGKTHQLTVPKGKTILEALQEADADPPYSCQSGVCATCIAKVTNGEAKMRVCMALDDDEIENGMILTCQAVPVTEEISVEY